MSLSRQVASPGCAEASAHPADRSDGTNGPPAAAETGAAPPLRSVHTTNFPALLDQLGISLLVTTYQAGKLVVLRADQDHVNTHFRNFSQPMGLAVAGDRLAVGTLLEIWEFHNVPAVAPKLEPIGRHDACFLPRSSHVTGDIQVHEMAWAGDELWFVNTRFSCLCTRSAIHSFVPRWRPPFVSALAPEDRCHLNGLGLRDGQPALRHRPGARPITPAGWRANKKDGGILLDVPTNEVLVRGLSMPHSPRWYAGRLWVLESGDGRRRLRRSAHRPLREPSPSCPASPADSTFAVRWPSSACRRCARAPSSAASPSPSALAGTRLRRLGAGHRRRARRSPSCGSRTRCRRSSPSRSCPGGAFRT